MVPLLGLLLCCDFPASCRVHACQDRRQDVVTKRVHWKQGGGMLSLPMQMDAVMEVFGMIMQ